MPVTCLQPNHLGAKSNAHPHTQQLPSDAGSWGFPMWEVRCLLVTAASAVRALFRASSAAGSTDGVDWR